MVKNFPRLCAIFICIILLLSAAGAPSLAAEGLITVHYSPFVDVPETAWYRSAADFAYQNSLIVGVDETHFAPQLQTSRAMLVSILWRSCGAPESTLPDFSDVAEDAWYAEAVGWAAESGIVSGTGDGYFSPNALLTREQFAAMLFRFSDFLGKNTAQTAELSGFPDVGSVSTWAKDAMQWAVGASLIAGTQADGKTLLSPLEGATRAQAAAILMRLLQEDFPQEDVPVETLSYGKSGSGSYPLTAYRVGTGKNVLLLTYAIHGWEDNYDRDGQSLVYLAECVLQTLRENPSVVKNGNWTVYILPCLNPDGLYLGTTCNGKGRCTTTRLSGAGSLLSDKGIDMNRCFPYRYTSFSDARNFNGTAPLQCTEALALAEFVRSVRGEGYNLCIDTHGWFNQVIAKTKGGTIEKAFYAQFPASGTGNLANGSGYFSAWAGFELGYDACLFELPGVYSHKSFTESGNIQRYERAILTILTTYVPSGSTRSVSPGELNGN
ncbi:MAG: S-layer homology domain-containing protein [Clostridia bacterium]|nr:S-layer homology domain-containing protein [Clostridia bacterium]